MSRELLIPCGIVVAEPSFDVVMKISENLTNVGEDDP